MSTNAALQNRGKKHEFDGQQMIDCYYVTFHYVLFSMEMSFKLAVEGL